MNAFQRHSNRQSSSSVRHSNNQPSPKIHGGSFNPQTLGRVLVIAVAILLLCNAYTLYLLNNAVNSEKNCNDKTRKLKIESFPHPIPDTSLQQKLHKDKQNGGTSINTPNSKLTSDKNINKNSDDERSHDHLSFVPFNDEIDQKNYQNPNPIMPESHDHDESKIIPNDNDNNNNHEINAQNAHDLQHRTRESNQQSTKQLTKKQQKTNKSKKNNNKRQKEIDNLTTGVMKTNWINNPLIPTRTAIIKINTNNQNNFINNKKLQTYLTNRNLWQYNNNNMEVETEYCDWKQEILFNNTIKILSNLKQLDQMPMTMCPTEIAVGWRPHLYVPFIHGNSCEPWWHRDAVFIMSRLLNKNMKVLEYGSGASTLWMTRFVNYIIGVEFSPDWVGKVTNRTHDLNISNIEVRIFPLGRKYVEIDFTDNPGGLTNWARKDDDVESGIDFISVDGELRYPCMEYAFKHIKPHGGIILLDNSDRPGNDGQNVTTIMPDHWLKFESSNLERHTKNLPTQRWILNSQSTIYITRDKKCMK